MVMMPHARDRRRWCQATARMHASHGSTSSTLPKQAVPVTSRLRCTLSNGRRTWQQLIPAQVSKVLWSISRGPLWVSRDFTWALRRTSCEAHAAV